MTYDESTRSASVAADPGRTDASLTANAVLVADSDQSVTDRVAALLRDRYTVRTAYSGEDVLASIDEDVGVILFDPAIRGASTARLLGWVDDEAIDCQIAALASRPPDRSDVFDDVLRKPVAPDRLRSTVDRLSRQATYRIKLERYYTLVERAAGSDSPERAATDERLADLRDELNAVVTALDQDEAYYAALREHDGD